MRQLFRLQIIIILLLLPITLTAQYFNSGQDAASVKWFVAKNNRFQIIFPAGYEPLALKFAVYVNAVATADSVHLRRPLPVLFHPWNPYSNGFVTLVPRRMELYSVSPQDIYPQEWLKQLAAHEFQHSVQLEELNHGLVRILTYPFGEQAWGASLSFTPRWFLEGDAVVSETRFSKSGRGRLPSFEQGHRAAFLTGKTFTYDKWLLGSYRDYIPDYYEFGYKLVSYVNLKYGDSVWPNVMHYTARNPFTLAPFYFGLKKYAGVSRQQLFHNTFSFLDSAWVAEDRNIKPQEGFTVPSLEKSYTSYYYPCYLNDSIVVAYKSGLKETPSLVTINVSSGKEESLIVTGSMFDPFSVASGMVAWDDYLPSVRWGEEGKSIINLLRIKDHKIVSINYPDQLFSPSLDSQAQQFVAVSVARNGLQKLIIYDLKSMSLKKTVSFPLGVALQNPSWDETRTRVVFTKVDSLGKSLCVFSFANNSVSTLLSSEVADIATPKFLEGYVVFSSYSGSVNNLFAIDTASHQLFRITNSRFGAQYPSVAIDGRGVVFSKYTASGYRIAIIQDSLFSKKVPVQAYALGFHDPLEAHIGEFSKSVVLDTAKVSNFSINPYRKGLHLFNFHSWAPFYYDPLVLTPSTAEFAPGFTLMSQNILSTSLSVLGYSFQNGSSQYHARFIYKGWFPVISISADYGAQPLFYRDSIAKTVPIINADQLDLNGIVSLPLNFSRGKFVRWMTPSISVGHTNDYFYNRTDSSYTRDYTTTSFRLYYYSSWESAPRDIRPRWGKIVDIRYTATPFENENTGSIASILFRQMLPGIAVNHSLMLSFGIQKQYLKRYYFSSNLFFPRGYATQPSKELKTFTLDYALPIAYPDWAIPNFLYLQRIRLNAFFDWAENSYDVYDNVQKSIVTLNPIYQSLGVDIGFDYHLFRNAFPLSTQFRLGDTKSNEPFFSLFFGITIN
ncbi:MAG TPA: hypothetical protein VMV56_04540 [Williamwhitmania sp.]|nr:hypothetical protein [Williamwhitmania sp.]